MSTDLARSATILADPAFVARVRAAVIEHASPVATTDRLAQLALWDPDQVAGMFARLCADDTTISAATLTSLGNLKDAEIRRVVDAKWNAVTMSLRAL